MAMQFSFQVDTELPSRFNHWTLMTRVKRTTSYDSAYPA